MEANVSLNLVTIGRDGRPRQMGLAEVIGEWTAFRLDVLERRLQAPRRPKSPTASTSSTAG